MKVELREPETNEKHRWGRIDKREVSRGESQLDKQSRSTQRSWLDSTSYLTCDCHKQENDLLRYTFLDWKHNERRQLRCTERSNHIPSDGTKDNRRAIFRKYPFDEKPTHRRRTLHWKKPMSLKIITTFFFSDQSTNGWRYLWLRPHLRGCVFNRNKNEIMCVIARDKLSRRHSKLFPTSKCTVRNIVGTKRNIYICQTLYHSRCACVRAPAHEQ